MNKYRVLIVGAGGQGSEADQPGSGNEHKIISYGHAFRNHDGFLLNGFWDDNIKKEKKAIDMWDANVKGYCCLNHAIEDNDIVVVATPDNTHYKILKQLAEYPLKLVICEKPICGDLEQAREIIELYKQKKIPLMVDNTRNFIPELRNLTKEHGRAVSGYALFNRGLLHSATHIFGFFRMLECTNYKIRELNELDFRVWVLSVTFEDGFIWSEERITDDIPVPDIYDYHMKYLVDNAYNFLEGKEELFYTGEMALKDIEECYDFKAKSNNISKKSPCHRCGTQRCYPEYCEKI